MKPRIVFMGTPLFATNVLQKLIDNYDVVLVVCQPDKEVGRKRILTACPIKEMALNNNIEVFQPLKLRNDYDKIVSLNPDLIVTCAYGQIVSKEVLDCAKYKAINVHASLLPEYRGASPISQAIVDGKDKTGITIMYMDEGLDTGDIISTKEVEITNDDNLETLSNKLSIVGANLLIDTIPSILNNTNNRVKQDDKASSYAHMIKREDELINFNDKGINIINKIRGLYPNTYFKLDDLEIKVLSATYELSNETDYGIIKVLDKNNFGITCQDGIIYLKEIKPSGKNAMLIKNYLNGLNKEKYLNKRVD